MTLKILISCIKVQTALQICNIFNTKVDNIQKNCKCWNLCKSSGWAASLEDMNSWCFGSEERSWTETLSIHVLQKCCLTGLVTPSLCFKPHSSSPCLSLWSHFIYLFWIPLHKIYLYYLFWLLLMVVFQIPSVEVIVNNSTGSNDYLVCFFWGTPQMKRIPPL